MLGYLDNLLYLANRYDKFWVYQNDQIDNYPISK